MLLEENIAYGPHPLQRFDLYRPTVLPKKCPVIIHFHGGGLTGGEKKSHPYINELIALGYTFFDCNYRLLPEVTPDEILNDCATAVRRILDILPTLGDMGKVFIAGDSAGAWITMMLAFKKSVFANADIPETAISGYVFDDAMPIIDFNKAQHFKYITDLLENPECPFYYLEEGSFLPPMYFSTFGASVPYFPEYVHMAVATLFRMGYGDRITFEFFPHLPHCGNFEAKDTENLIPYVRRTNLFYRSIVDKK